MSSTTAELLAIEKAIEFAADRGFERIAILTESPSHKIFTCSRYSNQRILFPKLLRFTNLIFIIRGMSGMTTINDFISKSGIELTIFLLHLFIQLCCSIQFFDNDSHQLHIKAVYRFFSILLIFVSYAATASFGVGVIGAKI